VSLVSTAQQELQATAVFGRPSEITCLWS